MRLTIKKALKIIEKMTPRDNKKLFLVLPPSLIAKMPRKEIKDNFLRRGLIIDIYPNKLVPKNCKHAEGPVGYSAHMVWLEWMSKKYTQHKCPKCGLYKIWRRKNA